MAVLWIAPENNTRIEKAQPRKKSYMYACSTCKGEFYFCGMNCNYNYCPRCGRPFVKGDANGR